MENSNQPQNDPTLGRSSAMQLGLVVRDALVPLFLGLLSQGVIIFIQAGCSLKELLCDQLSIQAEYLDARIKTIFINSKAVDDVNSTIVENDSTLALSGPMPGLAGATFRRGGFFSGMRSQISYDKTPSVASKSTGKISLKLFNLVAKELGPGFLERGVWLKREQLENFISENADQLNSAFISATLDGQDIESTALSSIDFTTELVRVQVESG